MKKLNKICLLTSVLIFAVGVIANAGALKIEKIVDDFQNATDLQREQILKDTLGKEISAGGIVSNVGEYDFFDIVNDLKGSYYQLSTEQQKTKNNTPYQAILLFKDKDKVKDLDKGNKITKDGKIIRIEDERLQIAVWLLCGELSNNDKILLK